MKIEPLDVFVEQYVLVTIIQNGTPVSFAGYLLDYTDDFIFLGSKNNVIPEAAIGVRHVISISISEPDDEDKELDEMLSLPNKKDPVGGIQ